MSISLQTGIRTYNGDLSQYTGIYFSAKKKI